jgi:hypothetical protein
MKEEAPRVTNELGKQFEYILLHLYIFASSVSLSYENVYKNTADRNKFQTVAVFFCKYKERSEWLVSPTGSCITIRSNWTTVEP